MSNKIKSFEDACKALAITSDPQDIPEKHQKAILAHYMLIIITEALNEGWQPNWNDHSEYKYFPWFEIKASKEKPGGFGFSVSLYSDSYSHSYLGSRLCFKSRDLAMYAGKQFEKLYQDYFLIQ